MIYKIQIKILLSFVFCFNMPLGGFVSPFSHRPMPVSPEDLGTLFILGLASFAIFDPISRRCQISGSIN